LNNTAISELLENSFGYIKFGSIRIRKCTEFVVNSFVRILGNKSTYTKIYKEQLSVIVCSYGKPITEIKQCYWKDIEYVKYFYSFNFQFYCSFCNFIPEPTFCTFPFLLNVRSTVALVFAGIVIWKITKKSEIN
jgi:hypothetical protein